MSMLVCLRLFALLYVYVGWFLSLFSVRLLFCCYFLLLAFKIDSFKLKKLLLLLYYIIVYSLLIKKKIIVLFFIVMFCYSYLVEYIYMYMYNKK